MASTSSSNVNDLLPGLESFLRSMLNSSHLDGDHRQIAAMYVDKLDQIGKSTNQQTPFVDDQSLMNAEIASDIESDDFTDEEEEQRKLDLEEQLRQQQQQLSTPTIPRRSTNSSSSQWYIDMPKNTYLEALSPQVQPNDKIPSRLSSSTPSSTIIADGLLLTYDENHNWIWRYYVLDDYDLICFPADKKSQTTNSTLSDNDCSPLWVSDMTNAKVQTTVLDKVECLCLQIGLAEAIYVRPPDPNQIPIWLKAFRDATASTQKSKGRSNVKTLSRNARRVFAQFNRKKGQIVSHLLDQMASVAGVDDKTRKHCELRGFLVVSLDNQTFVTKYCTIVDGIFRVHKSRLSDQTEQELHLNRCKLSFPEERTRDIQFALIDEQVGTIFIRGNNIYSMGRLLNTLAKYVEIAGSSQFIFAANPLPPSATSTPLSKHRQTPANSIQTHIYSDVDAVSSTTEIYAASSIKSDPISLPSLRKAIYHNASQLHEDEANDRTFVVPTRRTAVNVGSAIAANLSNETYDAPKPYDNVAVMSTPIVDRNNNHVVSPPQRQDKSSRRSKSKPSRSFVDPPSSPEQTVSCLGTSENSSTRRRPHQNPLPPRRASTQTSPSDYVNKLANLFTKHFSTPLADPQTYDALPSSPPIPPRSSTNSIQSSKTVEDLRTISKESPISKRVYDIPITIERSAKCIITPFEQYQKPTLRSSRSVEPILSFENNEDEEEETPYSQGYDNLAKNDGIGKFRFVVPFNHSSTSAFIQSNSNLKPINSPTTSSASSSSSSSFSTIRPTTTNSNLNTRNSNLRSTLMTAV